MSTHHLYLIDQAGTLLGTSHYSLTSNNAFSPYGYNFNETFNPIYFKAEPYVPLTGGYPLGSGHRFYMTRTIRFSSPDIFSPFGVGGINSYTYCAGDPINYTDPTGKSRTPLWRLRKLTTKYIKSNHRNEKFLNTQKTPARQVEFSELPNEMINKITDFLSSRDQLSFSQTSPRHRELILAKNEYSISAFNSKYANMGQYKKSSELLKLKFSEGSTPHTNLIGIVISKKEAIRKTTSEYPVPARPFQNSYGR